MLLEVQDLCTEFGGAGNPGVAAVRGVSFAVDGGQTLGLVGESGCGKSVTALSIARLIDPPGRITRGSVSLDGVDLLRIPERAMRKVRGKRIAFVFQDPMTALNPVLTIGAQLVETIRAHQPVSAAEAHREAVHWLESVRISLPQHRMRQYPFELSGGMRQRVMLALAFSCHPEVLIADEPTTALDVTVQAQILDLMDDLQKQIGTAIILITHDLGVVAQRADRILVMYAGQIVEDARAAELFSTPRHPYTKALLASLLDVWRAPDGSPLPSLAGSPPHIASGAAAVQECAFRPRCSLAFAACARREPPLLPVESGAAVRCLLYNEPPAKRTDAN